jgi:hypothetical protein
MQTNKRSKSEIHGALQSLRFLHLEPNSIRLWRRFPWPTMRAIYPGVRL